MNDDTDDDEVLNFTSRNHSDEDKLNFKVIVMAGDKERLSAFSFCGVLWMIY